MPDDTLQSVLARLLRAMPRNADVMLANKLASGPAKPIELRDPRNATGYWAKTKRAWRAKQPKKKPSV